MNEKNKECMKVILSKDWTIDGETKKIWQWIGNKKLTAATAFKGELYDKASVKIIYVGHAVNGWQFDASGCETLESTLEVVLNQPNGLPTLVNRDGCQDEVTGKLYRHINSKFLRLIKCVLEEVGESDGPTSEDTWYSDSKSWNEKFVWSNLYNIAPRNGGNPDNKMIKPCMEQYVDMFKAQLDEYKPDIVIACPLSGYFIPWVREKSFDEILIDYKDLSGENGPVISEYTYDGSYGRTKVIVCKRPDRIGYSYDDVTKMAKYIKEKYIK